MLPLFLLEPAMQKRIEESNQSSLKRRTASAVPWTPDIKWAKELNIQASSYTLPMLFPELPAVNCGTDGDPNKGADKGLVSPNGEWLYMNKVLPAGVTLDTMQGNRKGSVLFDGPVVIPAVHNRPVNLKHGWRTRPYMSLTPMELLSLRPGTKKAKKHTIVAGLGLGYQLIEVSKRKQVTKLRLIEQSRDLVDWFWPRIEPQLGCKVDIVIGDARELLPKMKADVALVDIFPDYGGNGLYRDTPGIQTVWCWGAA